MKNITLKWDSNLIQLSKTLSLPNENVIDRVIEGLDEFGFIQNHWTDAGQSVKYLLKEYNTPVFEFATAIGFPINSEVLELTGNLFLWGMACECPECGCELEITHKGVGTKDETRFERCTNTERCDYSDEFTGKDLIV